MRIRLEPKPPPYVKEFLTIYRRPDDFPFVPCACGEGEPHGATLEIHLRPEFLDVGGHPLPTRPEESWIRILVCENAYMRTLGALARAGETLVENG